VTAAQIIESAAKMQSQSVGAERVELGARGEPFLWALGGALALGIAMILGFLALIVWNGAAAFWPRSIHVLTLHNGERVAGKPVRREEFRAGNVLAVRTLYQVGNYDLYGEDYRWIVDETVRLRSEPVEMVFVERREWGPYIGRIAGFEAEGQPTLATALARAEKRLAQIRVLERDKLGAINRELEAARLGLRRIALTEGTASAAMRRAERNLTELQPRLEKRYAELAAEAALLKELDAREQIRLVEIGGRETVLPLSSVVRIVEANRLSFAGAVGIYLGRWLEFLIDEPREANTEGGVWPAIFGTFSMTLLMVLLVTPLGVVTALYLREYARQGTLVSIVRISVNNLAGVPSIVYGVFGLGFFAYVLGGSIDDLFFPEFKPNPIFGTGGLLWASLTLALLTVPVVIVATEEALAAVPRSVREGSLACGASKWQTLRYVVLPQAMPGIMTGIILAMARGASEVAPLMLVGVVKLAPELPIDGVFPFLHLERSFMHLGFHIFDVGFQSRNSEAGKPMVFVTTLLLITLIFSMNLSAIVIRNRLQRRFASSKF
jgi:phosphate transport system permease protein